MPTFDPFFLALAALAVDSLTGDPGALYRWMPHPVAALGRVIDRLDRRFNVDGASDAQRLARGGAVAIGVTLAAAGAGALLHALAIRIPAGGLVEAIVASTLIAFRGLYDHVHAVARAMRAGIAEARAAVSHVVGRNPEHLDGPGVARAAIESVAENFADAVVAPIFWYVLLGLPGLFACKAINTLDSMIGNRGPRHLWFGRVAARVDDAMNWLPARLTAALLVATAAIMPGANATAAVRAVFRDAKLHRSVNAGWPEAALAGALGFAIAGPRRYDGYTADDDWIGGGRHDVDAHDVHAALRLYVAATALLAAVLAAGWLAI